MELIGIAIIIAMAVAGVLAFISDIHDMTTLTRKM